MSLRAVLDRIVGSVTKTNAQSSWRGTTASPSDRLQRMYDKFWIDPSLYTAILDIRHMDAADGRVKKIHGRMARASIKGGLQLMGTDITNKRISRAWVSFRKRLDLHKQQKLESDARGLIMEGNLPIQWVVNETGLVVAGVRMPSETIKPIINANGQFTDVSLAYKQTDHYAQKIIANFAEWQLTLGRLGPSNYDDMGSFGRPYMDASRSVWQKLTMTEEDLVIRRRERAPLRTAHVLEGADEAQLMQYKERIEDQQKDITTNYYLNTKGAVSAVQGDANLDQIADVSYLLDTFFSGSPAPKGLFGYADGLSRDILEDLKKDFYEELDALQDTLADVYQKGFELQLLLDGINPDAYDVRVGFAERTTSSANQRADLALKYSALGVGYRASWEAAGLDPAAVLKSRDHETNSLDPYPISDDFPEDIAGSQPSVKVTPSNARKGESATTISTRS